MFQYCIWRNTWNIRFSKRHYTLVNSYHKMNLNHIRKLKILDLDVTKWNTQTDRRGKVVYNVHSLLPPPQKKVGLLIWQTTHVIFTGLVLSYLLVKKTHSIIQSLKWSQNFSFKVETRYFILAMNVFSIRFSIGSMTRLKKQTEQDSKCFFGIWPVGTFHMNDYNDWWMIR